ncbi:MAG: SPOR domain-containing protein [Prevotella sp.]|nr:SPOR domain-containing protein [Prevotella sp.]
MVELAKHIEILLLNNDCVIVPGFGGFMAHHVDAVYDKEENMFLPPSRTLGFNPRVLLNDHLLAQSYIEAYDISYPDAIKRIEAEVSEMRQAINNQGFFELPDIGVIQTNDDGNLEFEPCSAGILTPELYALTSFELHALRMLPEKQEEIIPVNIETISEAQKPVEEEPAKATVVEMQQEEVESEYEESDDDVVTIKVSTLKRIAAVALVLIVAVFAILPFSGYNYFEGLQKGSIDTGLLTKVMPKAQTTTPEELGAIKVINGAAVRIDRTEAENKVVAEAANRKAEPVSEVVESKPTFVIVLASRVTKTNAERYVSSLIKKGVKDARVIAASNGSKVICGKYSSESEAMDGVHELREMSSEFKDAWVMETMD